MPDEPPPRDHRLHRCGGAGALAAMVPASALVLGAAMLLSRNVYQGLLRPRASQAEVLRVSRLLVLVVMATALAFAVGKPSLIADLLLAAYDGVTQLFPAVLLALVWRRTSKVGVAAGVTVGVALVLYLMFGKHDPLWGLNAGFVALAVNTVVVVGGSVLFPPRRHELERADHARRAVAPEPVGA